MWAYQTDISVVASKNAVSTHGLCQAIQELGLTGSSPLLVIEIIASKAYINLNANLAGSPHRYILHHTYQYHKVYSKSHYYFISQD